MKLKKAISLLIVFSLCLTIIPGGAYAVDGESIGDSVYVARIGEAKFTSLKAAVEAAADQDTIVLIADSEGGETVEIAKGKVIRIDLNGYTFSSTATDQAILVSGVLVLEDSQSNQGSIRTGEGTSCAIRNVGDMEITGGSVVAARCAIYTTGESATILTGGRVESTAASQTEDPLETFAVRSDHFFYAQENANVVGTWGAIAIEGGYSSIESGTFDGGAYYGLYVKDGAPPPEGGDYCVDVSGGTFNGSRAVYSDLDCDALSVTGGSFSSNPGRHVKRGYAAGRRDEASPYLVGEVTVEENRAVIQAPNEDPFYVTLKVDETTARFAPGSVDLINLSHEASLKGLIVDDDTELIAYVDADGPDVSEWSIAYTINPFWRKGSDEGHPLVSCLTDESAITVHLDVSPLSVEEGDLVYASGDSGGGENPKALILHAQYDSDLDGFYVDLVFTASSEWISDWTLKKVEHDDYVAGVLDPIDGFVEYERLEYAFEDASHKNGATIIMLNNSDEHDISVKSGSYIFDLNGKKVHGPEDSIFILDVDNDVNLTILDSSEHNGGEMKAGRAAIMLGTNTTLTIKGGTLFGNDAGIISTGNLVEVQGRAIYGGVSGIKCYEDHNTKVIVKGDCIVTGNTAIDSAGSVEVYGGDIFAAGDKCIALAAVDGVTIAGGAVEAIGNEAITIAAGGEVTVGGGNVSVNVNTSDSFDDGLAILSQDTVTVLGGTVAAKGLRSAAIEGNATVSGGVVSASGELSVALAGLGGTVTVNDGTVSASGDGSSAISSLLVVTVSGGEISADGEDSAALYNEGTTPSTVTGGKFTGALKANGSGTDYIAVSGGIFSEDPTPWLVPGYEAEQNPDDRLWYVQEHVDISAVWADDYSGATLTVTSTSGDTETFDASVTLSENEDHSFNITAVGEDTAGISYSATLENVPSFRVAVNANGGQGAAEFYLPKAQDKDYAAFRLTTDILVGITPPSGTEFDSLTKGSDVWHVGDTIQVTVDSVFDAQWRSTWAMVNEALTAGQKITLFNDIAPEEDDLYLYVPTNAKPTLNLSGHTIDRALTEAIANGCVLRVDGCLTLSRGTITGGNNAGNGGGLFVNSSGSVEASDMTFTENNAANGGGVYVADGGAYSQDGSSVTGNHAVSYGGGLFIGGDGLNSALGAGLRWPPGGDVVGVRNVEIVNNFAGLDGGGVYIGKNSLEVDDGSKIINNKVGDSNNNIGVADGLENPLLLPKNPTGPIMLGFPALVASAPAWAWLAFIGIPAIVLGVTIYVFWDGNSGEQGQTCNHPSWKSDGAWWENQYYSSVKEVETCTRCGMTREEERVPAISVDEKTNITTYTVTLSDGTEDKREVGPYTVVLDTGMDPNTFILPEGYSHTKTITIPHTRHQTLSFPLTSELLWLPFDSTGPQFECWLIDGTEVDVAQFDGGNDDELINVMIEWLFPVLYEHGADGKLDKLDPVSGNPPQEENPSFVPPNTMHTLLPNLPPEKGWQRTVHRFDGWEESIGAQIDIKGGLLSFAYSYAGVAPGVPHKQAGQQIMINKPTGIKAQWITPWADLARTLNYSVAETAILWTDIPAIESDSTISIKQGRIAELQLNGFSLLGLGPAAPLTFNIITVGQDAVLTVTDVGSGSPGTLKLGYSILNGGGVKVASGGKFILQGADICDNLTLQQTYIDPQGHEIKSGDCHGGGVFIDKEGQFDMFSGRIRDNLAFGSGGGVYISEDSLFEMKGGSIIDNKAKWTSEVSSTQGGGVYVGGTFNVSGKVIIKDNIVDGEASNVYLPTGKLINVAGKLDGEAEIHVTMQTPGVFTNGLNSGGGDQARGSAANFVSDDPNYVVVINDEGEAELVFNTVHFAGYDLVLDGTLGLRFYVSLPNDFVGEGAYMDFTFYDKTQHVDFTDAEMYDNGRVFTCHVPAHQMADPILAVFHYGDNQSVSKQYSIKDYLEEISEGASSSLAKAVKNYGHYVQPYMTEVHGWTFGPGGHGVMPADHEITEMTDATDYAHRWTTYDTNRLQSVQYYLTLDSSTVLNVRVKLKGDIQSVTAMVDNKPCALRDLGNNTWLISVPNIAGVNLGRAYRIEMTADESTVLDLEASALSYVNTALTFSDSDAEKLALTALYDYYDAHRTN